MKQHTRSHTSFDEAFAYEVLSVVEEIPEGKVATYGQIARLIGKEKNSRLVARALSHAEQFGEFPCHRVVNHAGRLAPGSARRPPRALRRPGPGRRPRRLPRPGAGPGI